MKKIQGKELDSIIEKALRAMEPEEAPIDITASVMKKIAMSTKTVRREGYNLIKVIFTIFIALITSAFIFLCYNLKLHTDFNSGSRTVSEAIYSALDRYMEIFKNNLLRDSSAILLSVVFMVIIGMGYYFYDTLKRMKFIEHRH